MPWDDRELKLSFATFRDRLRPGAKETWRVNVRSADGKPPEAGAAELLAYMYDRSLDVFAPHNPPSVLSLYPTRTGTSWVRASLGQSRAWHLLENGFAQVSSAPSLVPTSLKRDDRYGIGGMGVRHRGVYSMAAAAPMQERRAARSRRTPRRARKSARSRVDGAVRRCRRAESPASTSSRAEAAAPRLHPSRCAASSRRPPSGSRTC